MIFETILYPIIIAIQAHQKLNLLNGFIEWVEFYFLRHLKKMAAIGIEPRFTFLFKFI